MLNTYLLDAPRAALVDARQRLEHAAAARERGLTAYSAANDRIRALDDEDARHASVYAERLEEAANTGELVTPYLEVPAADAAERHGARVAARGAAEALDRLKSAHAAAQADVATAERALHTAVDQVLDSHACGLMEQAERHLATLERIGAELAELLPDGRFENQSGLPSEPAVRELLKRLPARPRSDVDVPVNELRHGGARVSRLAELRAELMNASEPPAQAAA